MRRNTLLCVLSAGLAYVALTLVDAPDSVTEAAVSAESSTILLGELMLRDTFDDNRTGSLWHLYNEDPNNVAIVEANSRLEFRSTSSAANVFAGYIANAWRLDPVEDFALRVDAHYDLKTLAGGWIGLGIAPNADTPRERSVEVGIGCSGLLPFYWYDQIERWPIESSRASRFADNAVLHISYTTEDDTLYVSDTGYGPDEAWMAFPGLLQGQWEGEPVYIYLGGRSEGLDVPGGRVYLDNLLVEKGLVVESSLQEVYRFWSPVTGSHFYTMSEWEREKLLLDFQAVWTYEGVAYYAFPDDSDPTCRPVHRFWSDSLGRHFYTMNESEKQTLLDKHADTWIYEGVAFFAYPEGLQPQGTLPVYRFKSESRQAHFYTISEQEKNAVLSNYADVWAYEGIVWYAHP